MRKISKYSVCFFVALFLLSCSNDELETNQETVKDVKYKLELAKFSNPNIAQNVEADFENANEIEKDNFKISEFSAKEKVVNYFESDLLQNQLKYQGVTIENDGKAHSYFLEVYTLKKSATYPESITKLKDFSGTLNVYSFEGKNLGSVSVTKGEAKNISEKQELDILTKAINLFSFSSNTTNRIPPCNTPYYQPMQFTIYWHTEVIVDNKVISYVLSNVTTETIVVETSYPCDAAPPEVARAYRYEIIGRSGGGSGTTPPLPDVVYTPPSCQSFNFSETASLWQTALVKNISFNIILLSEKGVTFIHSAKFRQPISFGMPKEHSVGGTPISAGMAAELSAKALQTTIREVVAKYGRVKVSEMIVEQYFKERLLYNYPLITSGGRVNWTATENLPVTDYETTFMLPDNCE